MDDLIEKSFIFISKKEELGLTNQAKNYFDFNEANAYSEKLGDLLLQGCVKVMKVQILRTPTNVTMRVFLIFRLGLVTNILN
jgi:hypothetical protein